MLRWVGLGKSTSRIRIYKSAAVANGVGLGKGRIDCLSSRAFLELGRWVFHRSYVQ